MTRDSESTQIRLRTYICLVSYLRNAKFWFICRLLPWLTRFPGSCKKRKVVIGCCCRELSRGPHQCATGTLWDTGTSLIERDDDSMRKARQVLEHFGDMLFIPWRCGTRLYGLVSLGQSDEYTGGLKLKAELPSEYGYRQTGSTQSPIRN